MNKVELLEKWGKPIPVGHSGMVRLVDVMGDDSSIVQAARVSYGNGTKTKLEDESLIRYLVEHRHNTPIEMCEIKLHIRLPIYICRQLIRHRTASVNEYSMRYSVPLDMIEETAPEEWRLQSMDNKQGSSGLLIDNEKVTYEKFYDRLHRAGKSNEEINFYWRVVEEESAESSLAEYLTSLETNGLHNQKEAYNIAIGLGVAREQARKFLTVNEYTQLYWKIDASNLLNFISLRSHSHAQQEIREFAEVIDEIVKDWLPALWQAHRDYRINARTFSAMEMEALQAIIAGDLLKKWGYDCEFQELPRDVRVEFLESFGLTKRRERIAFYKKIVR